MDVEVFLIITDNFVALAHEAFRELGYHIDNISEINSDDLQECAINTLNHCKDLSDARNASKKSLML